MLVAFAKGDEGGGLCGHWRAHAVFVVPHTSLLLFLLGKGRQVSARAIVVAERRDKDRTPGRSLSPPREKHE